MDDVIVIDPTNPLLVPFTIQHDFRERFAHALEEIVAAHESGGTAQDLYNIAKGAISPDDVAEWFDAGRPLPWLDQELGGEPAALTQRVLDMIGAPGLITQ